MRRTYKSKKDTLGSLDPRDLMIGVDEKSSAFDAFYIQNIKQTKRELSAMGASNQHGVASNKVRKRKYVKRIIKELEPSLRESISGSVFLTPDKSIRLNKAPDPFDQLLNSSPVTFEPRNLNKDDLFDRIRKINKPVKNYIKKKQTHKKINYSSDSFESDKENSTTGNNDTQNTTDIGAHQFLIEKDTKPNPKIDESISKIVKNLSLINNLHQTSLNSVQKPKYNHRLTKNFSPLNSPLSSTPFTKKQRSKSIYKFSPIRMLDLQESHINFVTISEEQNLPNEPAPSTSLNFDKRSTPPLHFQLSQQESTAKSSSLFSSSDKEQVTVDTQQSKRKHNADIFVEEIAPSIEAKITNQEVKICDDSLPVLANDDKISENDIAVSKSSQICSKTNQNNSTVTQTDLKLCFEIPSIETSEAEPLLGFDKNEDEDKNKILSELQTSPLFSVNFGSNDSENISQTDEKEISIVFSVKKSNSQRRDESGNKKCSDNHSGSKIESLISNTEFTAPSQLFLGFEVNEVQNDSKVDIDNSISSNLNKTEEDNFVINSQGSDKESLYDTCYNSDESFSGEVKKVPIVALEKLSDSVFKKYYEKMNDSMNESLYENESFDSTMINIDEIERLKKESNELSNYDDNSYADKNSLTDNSDNSSIYEEADDTSSTEESVNRTISFVTTRRRNHITNNATIIVLDDSYASQSSSNADKTVLSNNVNLSCNDSKSSLISQNETIISKNNVGLSSTMLNTSKIAINEDHDEIFNNISSIQRTSLVRAMMTEVSEVNNISDDTVTDLISIINDSIGDHRERIQTDSKESVQNRLSHITTRRSTKQFRQSIMNLDKTTLDPDRPAIILQPGKKWERSLSIYKRMTMMAGHFDRSILEEEDLNTKGRKYRQSVIETMEMQQCINNGLLNNDTLGSRRSTLICKPNRTAIRIVKESSNTRVNLSNTSIEDLNSFIEDCDDTVVELSKLSIADADHEVTVLEKLHDTNRGISARDYVLRRCNQTEPILFDECYPDTLLKNCRKIGEGVYGEVYLWRAPDGRARVMKIVPIAGNTLVNGEQQKDFHEIIAEIVIAMELSALRAPIAEIECHLDNGKDIDAVDLHSVENATDVFNEVLTVRCVYGTYPSRLLDLWELYDETRGSENDTPAALPLDQQFIVLELANAGQDLESFQFNGAEQAYALFLQIAFALAVGEEAYQFEHRDLHWGNVLIAPTDQKYATFVIRGRVHRVLRCGVAGTIIDYSLSRVALRARRTNAALYNDLATDQSLFTAVGDRQFEVYRLMRDKLGNDWKNFEPYTNILWLHYIVDKMITAVRYKRTNTKTHKQHIAKLKAVEERILSYGSAAQFVLTDNEY